MKLTHYHLDQQVRVTDLNYGDHLGIPQLCGMAHNARLCFLKSLGLSESDIGGPQIMVAESNITIKKQCLHGDILRFYVTLEPISRTQFKCVISVLNQNVVVANIEDRLICYDYSRKRPVAIPDSFYKIMNSGVVFPEF